MIIARIVVAGRAAKRLFRPIFCKETRVGVEFGTRIVQRDSGCGNVAKPKLKMGEAVCKLYENTGLQPAAVSQRTTLSTAIPNPDALLLSSTIHLLFRNPLRATPQHIDLIYEGTGAGLPA